MAGWSARSVAFVRTEALEDMAEVGERDTAGQRAEHDQGPAVIPVQVGAGGEVGPHGLPQHEAAGVVLTWPAPGLGRRRMGPGGGRGVELAQAALLPNVLLPDASDGEFGGADVEEVDGGHALRRHGRRVHVADRAERRHGLRDVGFLRVRRHQAEHHRAARRAVRDRRRCRQRVPRRLRRHRHRRQRYRHGQRRRRHGRARVRVEELVRDRLYRQGAGTTDSRVERLSSRVQQILRGSGDPTHSSSSLSLHAKPRNKLKSRRGGRRV
jgi:hypothetical protein